MDTSSPGQRVTAVTHEKHPLTLTEYQSLAIQADRNTTSPFAFHLLGLFGEAGSLLSVAKKKQRDLVSYSGYEPAVVEELGDVLWYLAVVANRGGIDFSEIGRNANKELRNWITGQIEPLPFRDLQIGLHKQEPEPTPKFEGTLLNFAGEVGKVLSDHQSARFERNRDALAGCLVAVMRALVTAADEAGVSLEGAANANLTKIFDRWPIKKDYPERLDKSAKPFEKLPRNLEIEIFERDVKGTTYVFQRCHGIYIGDRLTDNAAEPDDYRFHDVFHYAYAAILTWSPVTRALLKLKRKSQPEVDEAEDGARAILIEEGITSWIFSRASKLDFFAGIKPGELSFDLLKHVREFVRGYESEQCPLWLWEDAILKGFEAFRFLQEHRRARIQIDMLHRTLNIEELPNDT